MIPIGLPALRDRGADIALIANVLAQRIAAEEGRNISGFSKDSEAFLQSHDWPGNVRELQNALRRAIITSTGKKIELSGTTPSSSRLRPATVSANSAIGQRGSAISAVTQESVGSAVNDFSGMTLEKIERMAIEQAISRSSGNICKAARGLGVSPSTIYRKLERWGT